MITYAKAHKLRELIVKASESLSDEDALEGVELFDPWAAGTAYVVDQRIRYNGTLYKVLLDHTSQADWTPDVASSLYVRVDDPHIEFPDWIQPVGSADAYALGAKVTHLEKHWISTVDNNVWEPSVYGWDEVI